MLGVESRVGEVLASKYRLEELLGSGGMGHVYRAVNEHVGRPVAIKVLRREHATNAMVVERFMREARAANLVRHPNVVDVLDIGADVDGTPFIVQELLTGEDLAAYVARRGGRLTLEEISRYLVPVIDAVAEAHAKQVVHRDIKPENVFLAGRGNHRVAKLLDFGISKVQLPNIRVTDVGVTMGTPAYMAPEQVQGARSADPRSDIWAIGVLLFEVLTGRLPFDALDAPALFVAIATKDAPRLLDVDATVDPEISRVVERCLKRLPDDRYPTAAELAADLRLLFDGRELEPTQDHPISSVPIPRASTRTLPTAAGATEATLVPDLVLPQRSSAPRVHAAAATELMTADTAPRAHDTVLQTEHAAEVARATSYASYPARSQPTPPRVPSPPPDPGPPPDLMTPAAPSRSRIAADRALPGVMLAPGTVSSIQRGTHASWGVPPKKETADVSWLIGLAVVSFVGIGTTGVLASFWRTADGLALVRFFLTPDPLANGIGQGVLCLGAFLLAGRSAKRGVHSWKGDLGGTRSGAIVRALLAGAFLFLAIEFFRAVY